jgi:uncharacterized protein
MAVITRFIVVRNGVELDQIFTDKKEAEAYDAMLDAADHLAGLIRQGDLQIEVDSRTIDAISIHLAQNAPEVLKILKLVKPLKPSKNAEAAKTEGEPAEVRKSAPEAKGKSKAKAN